MFKPASIEEEIILLFYKTGRLIRHYSHIVNSNEIGPVQVQALTSIESGKTTTGEIADDLQIAFPTASVLVDKLVENNLIERSQNPKDRRIIRLKLTSSGKKHACGIIHAKMKTMKKILKKLDSKDKKELKRIINRLIVLIEME